MTTLVGLTQEDQDDMFKHLTIMTHKEELIKKLKERMEIAERNLDNMEQNDGTSAIITPNVPLAALSPVERKRVEAAIDRDEKFAGYAAIARVKMKEKELLQEVIEDNKTIHKLTQEFNESKKKKGKRRKQHEHSEQLKNIIHDRKVKEEQQRAHLINQKKEYQLKLTEKREMEEAKKKKKKIIEKKEREALIAQIKEDQKRKSITAQKCRAEQKKLEQQYKKLLWLVEQKERQVVKTRVNNSRSPRKTSGRRITSPKKRTPKHSSKLHQRAEWQS